MKTIKNTLKELSGSLVQLYNQSLMAYEFAANEIIHTGLAVHLHQYAQQRSLFAKEFTQLAWKNNLQLVIKRATKGSKVELPQYNDQTLLENCQVTDRSLLNTMNQLLLELEEQQKTLRMLLLVHRQHLEFTIGWMEEQLLSIVQQEPSFS
jgi:hypothetical protein